MNQAAVRRIGRTLALVLPVVLVLSGTLAVAQVPWAMAPSESQVLASTADQDIDAPATSRGPSPAYAKLEETLVTELLQQDPSVALTSLQRAVDRKPELAEYCPELARTLGEAAVHKYGSVERAQEFSRPVCDTSFATGVAGGR